jgi:transketolase
MGSGQCGAYLKLRNLCAVVDINRLGQSDPTMHEHDIAAYAKIFRAFGWDVRAVNGHSIDAILGALKKIGNKGAPTAILARTIKGKGVSFLQDKNGWHGKPLKEDELQAALKEIGPMPDVDSAKFVRRPKKTARPKLRRDFDFEKTVYKEKTATRLAYGNALLALGKVNESVVVLDGDVKNSTYADKLFQAFPQRSFQSYIAEQNMVGMGLGFAAKGYIPFLATFAAFLTRAHDQVRMAAYSFSNIKLCGSHVGVSIGEDGSSQMGLEDLALFRPIPGCVVLYPSDAVSTEACVEASARHLGMCYIRTTRPATPLVYAKDEKFPIGGSKLLRKSTDDVVAIIAAGITVFEALKAYEELKKENIHVRVIDAYSVQPLDKENILKEVLETKERCIVVEDHFEGGGLGDAVAWLWPEKRRSSISVSASFPVRESRTSFWINTASAAAI